MGLQRKNLESLTGISPLTFSGRMVDVDLPDCLIFTWGDSFKLTLHILQVMSTQLRQHLVVTDL